MQDEILDFLKENQGSGPTKIAIGLKLSPSTVHAQLVRLESNGRVFKDKRGRYYREEERKLDSEPKLKTSRTPTEERESLLTTESLLKTRDIRVLLNEFNTTLEEVKKITKPQTKAVHLEEDLLRKLLALCQYSGEWNESAEIALRDLFTHMEKDFDDPNYHSIYLEMLLDILGSIKRNHPVGIEIKTKFGSKVQTMWDDPATLDSKGMVSLYLAALLLYFHDYDLKYTMSLMHSAISEWNAERFWVFHNALHRYGISEMSKQEGAKDRIRAFMTYEEDNAEGRDASALDKARKLEQLFRQHFMW